MLPGISATEISNFVMPSIKFAIRDYKKELATDSKTEFRLTIVVGTEEGKPVVRRPKKKFLTFPAKKIN